MNRAREDMIAGLTDDLTPVRSFRLRDGVILAGIAGLLSLAGVAVIKGLWMGAFQGDATPFFWITNGLLLLLGCASTLAVIAMASPHIGNSREAAKWATAMVGVLPLAAIISLIPRTDPMGAIADPVSYHCMVDSLVASLLVGIVLVLWLRRGAPVSHNAAGWHTGLAAGALGTVAYGLSCALDTMVHLGIWHMLPVVIAAVIGRLVVPPLIRW